MSFFKNLLKSDFSKNVLTLMTGTTIAQAIPIAITPILTRLYTPDDFGVFALFLAITAVAGSISNAQYEQAIILPEKDEDAFNLVAFGILIAFSFSLILLVLTFIFNSEIEVLLGNDNLGNLLYLIPLSTLLIGIYNSLNFFNIRKKKYKNISYSLISRSSSLGVSQVILGLFTLGPIGLIIGQMISFFSGNIMLYKTLKKNYRSDYITKEKIIIQVKKYKKFPYYSLPSILLNSINLNIINLLISFIFSIATLGFYTLAQRVVSIPARVIGNSFSQVYLQQASDLLKKTGSTKAIFLKSLKKLTIISFPIFLTLYFISEPIFAFVFGEEWRISGTYAKILIPLAAVRFVSSSLSNTFVVYQKQQFLMYFNMVLFIIIITVFSISKVTNLDTITTLSIYSFSISIIYLLLLLVNWNASKKKCIK
ncbi:MAG: oligosaccharide flippase family protein [Flavobacteriaceae bacterium]